MTALVTMQLVLTSNCPCSEGPQQSECSGCLTMALSLHQDCPYIEGPYKEKLLYHALVQMLMKQELVSLCAVS